MSKKLLQLILILCVFGAAKPAAFSNPSDELIAACGAGNVEVVERLMMRLSLSGININHVDAQGRTALIAACGAGNAEIVKRLMSRPSLPGININHVDAQGRTALIEACSAGNIEVVERLMKYLSLSGININHADAQGKTALLVAYEAGHDDIVAYLKKQRGVIIDPVVSQSRAITRLVAKKDDKLAAQISRKNEEEERVGIQSRIQGAADCVDAELESILLQFSKLNNQIVTGEISVEEYQRRSLSLLAQLIR